MPTFRRKNLRMMVSRMFGMIIMTTLSARVAQSPSRTDLTFLCWEQNASSPGRKRKSVSRLVRPEIALVGHDVPRR